MGRIRSSNRAADDAVDDAYAIDPDTDGLLLNWGRWMAGRTRGDASTSGMWRFASRGTRAAPTAISVPVDTDQARRVEVTICHPDFSPKMRALLKAHYVVNAHPNRTCTDLGIHHRAYAEWVWRASVFFINRFNAAYRRSAAASA